MHPHTSVNTILNLPKGRKIPKKYFFHGINSTKTNVFLDFIEKYCIFANKNEQAYIIFRLRSFSRNMRNELKNSRKIYFYDNGIRNSIIRNFAPAEIRGDVGALFENYIISERIKRKHYTEDYSLSHFWRTSTQQEIDYIEEKDGIIKAFEIKWNPNRKAKLPLSFKNAYPNVEFHVVNRNIFLNFLCNNLCHVNPSLPIMPTCGSQRYVHDASKPKETYVKNCTTGALIPARAMPSLNV